MKHTYRQNGYHENNPRYQEKNCSHLEKILKRHAVKKASIFGSFARGEAKARSDVDLLIEYKTKDKSLFDLVNLKAELEEILGRKVDIVTYNSIYWRLRDQILSEQVAIL
jgi:predicted nucleotidyltransferase